jgi:hypothetical protein
MPPTPHQVLCGWDAARMIRRALLAGWMRSIVCVCASFPCLTDGERSTGAG